MKAGDKVIVTKPMEVDCHRSLVRVKRPHYAEDMYFGPEELTEVTGEPVELIGVVVDGECVIEASFAIDRQASRYVRLIAYVTPEGARDER